MCGGGYKEWFWVCEDVVFDVVIFMEWFVWFFVYEVIVDGEWKFFDVVFEVIKDMGCLDLIKFDVVLIKSDVVFIVMEEEVDLDNEVDY